MKRLLFATIALVCGFGAWFTFKSYTWPIWTKNGVACLEQIEVNGDRQWLLIRGEDRSAPILLFLHGGPGMPAMYLGYAFQRPLERDFVVVHWDQRGAGKSYHADVDPATLSTSQLLRDAEHVIDCLRADFGPRKIFLVGHSHGTYLGVILASRHPELVAAYVGVGQIADRAEPLQDAFLSGKLHELGLPESTKIDGRNREDLLFRTGSELRGSTSPWPLIATGLLSTEYSLFDGLNVPKGPQLYARHMRYDVLEGAPMNTVIEFRVPIYFVMGRHDMVTPTGQARAYFDKLIAPEKKWYEFEQSAHFPFFEEPERFAAVMHEIRVEVSAGEFSVNDPPKNP